jgi:hypothetical protein
MSQSLLQFRPSGAELSGIRDGLAAGMFGDLGLDGAATGTFASSSGEIEALATEATARGFLVASSSPEGAVVIKDGWICRVSGGAILERIKPAPQPVQVADGTLTYRL